jgi:hypothetical protein
MGPTPSSLLQARLRPLYAGGYGDAPRARADMSSLLLQLESPSPRSPPLCWYHPHGIMATATSSRRALE